MRLDHRPRSSLRAVAAALLLAACASGPPAPPASAASVAGCYELRFSRFSRWVPAFALPVDAARGAAIVRVALDTTPMYEASLDRLARFGRGTGLMTSNWHPDSGGAITISTSHIDEWTTMELQPDTGESFLGVADTEGSVPWGHQHARMSARRVNCDGFVPGFDPGPRAKE